MAINIELIAKSNENWECVNLLMRYKPNRFSAAVSRLYYSIFLLVKCSMARNVENAEFENACKFWSALRSGFANHLESIGRLMP